MIVPNCMNSCSSADTNKRVKTLKFYSLKPLHGFLKLPAVLQTASVTSTKSKPASRKMPRRSKLQGRLQEAKQMKNSRPPETIFELTENFIPYQSADKATEVGLAINFFELQAINAEFSVVEHFSVAEIKHRPGLKKWDGIKKKMVSVQDPCNNKIKTESGAWIPASFKTGRYDEWKQKSKIEEQMQREAVRDDDGKERNIEQIVKNRMRLEFIEKKLQLNTAKKAENRKRSMRKNQRAGGDK